MKKRVLIIDDDKDDRFFFRNALSEHSNLYEFFEADNGKSGLDILNNSEALPDFIFLDLNMPLMNGKEFLKELKLSPSLKKINVIIYTTSENPNDKIETMKLGAINYIIKTADIYALPAILIRAMSI
jgi:PleD family two-component response regulator